MKTSTKLTVFCLFLFSLFPVASSQAPPKPAACTLVTQVEVICHYGHTTTHHTYTQPQKMASILNYLRLLRYHGKPETDPQTLSGDSYSITLQYSDGQRRLYRQHAYRYLSKNHRPWEKIDPVRARLLYPLLQLLPADQSESL